MDSFHSVLLEGVFSWEGPRGFCVQEGAETHVLEEVLGPFLGRQVRLALHHYPPGPMDPTKWGGGSCLWQPSACPAGHHEKPEGLYQVRASGVLHRDEGWFLVRPTRVVRLALDLMVGHHGRLLVATAFDRESAESMPRENLESIGDLEAQTEGLLGLLKQLRG